VWEEHSKHLHICRAIPGEAATELNTLSVTGPVVDGGESHWDVVRSIKLEKPMLDQDAKGLGFVLLNVFGGFLRFCQHSFAWVRMVLKSFWLMPV
jgi:hypothetical protein